MTEELQERLKTYTREQVYKAQGRCVVQAGKGVTKSGDGLRVELTDRSGKDSWDERTPRDARLLCLEKRSGKYYVNLPPIFDTVPTLGGRSIYSWPKPYLALNDGAWKVWAKLSYYRQARSFPEGPSAGVEVGSVEVVIEARPASDEPEPVSPEPPESGEGEEVIPPWPGQYVRWYLLGEVTGGVVSIGSPLPGNGWGGINVVTNTALTGDGHWAFGEISVVP